jgi:transcriptional regulator of NAD metabolism
LAGLLGVSRQIVVGDVALLRAAGYDVEATPRGYLLPGSARIFRENFCCGFSGDFENMRQGMYAIVDNGGVLETMEMPDPLYGQVTSRVSLSNRYEVDRFVNRAIDLAKDEKQSRIPCGSHVAVVSGRSRETLERIRAVLRGRGNLVEPQTE